GSAWPTRCGGRDNGLGGSLFDGKGKPTQVAAVSPGAATAPTDGPNVLNTAGSLGCARRPRMRPDVPKVICAPRRRRTESDETIPPGTSAPDLRVCRGGVGAVPHLPENAPCNDVISWP